MPILSASNTLRKDRHMSLDDNGIGFNSSIDWREKYNEVVEMLSETRAELDDFHQASKELETELETELQRTEMAHRQLQTKVLRAEHERDDWKASSKFVSLQTTFNTTTTTLQRELDQLRQEHQQTKVYLRELEMGNDDLERNERAVSSTLADMETKYSKALEEKILLEHELLEKAGVEEESQRLKDELRDANVEISILKDQLDATLSQQSRSDSQPPNEVQSSVSSTGDEQSSDLICEEDTITPILQPSLSLPALQSSRAISQQEKVKSIPLKYTAHLTSIALQSPTSSSTSSPRSFVKPPTPRNFSLMSSSTTGSLAKNKGVQMVSEMRARVRNLEQKIHTRVPRLRMASITGRQNVSSNINMTSPLTGTSSSSVTSNASTVKTSWESQRKSVESRLSNDSGSDKKSKKDIGDSSGWVLIMEDSPSPDATAIKDKRRLSNPMAPTSFRSTVSNRAISPSQSTGPNYSLGASTGLRRPQSTGVASSTSTSRPQTPTFLPLPTNSLYVSTSSKRSTAPVVPNLKRSSLGKTPITPVPPLPSNPTRHPAGDKGSKALPVLPNDLQANVTLRPNSRMPSSGNSAALSKSRIGRPSRGGISGRRSGGGELDSILDVKDLQTRSGSSAF